MNFTRKEQKEDVPAICGYDADSLAIVAALMKECEVSPGEVKELARNYIKLYGVVMKAVKKEFNYSINSLWMRVRYPGVKDVIKEMEGNFNENCP